MKLTAEQVEAVREAAKRLTTPGSFSESHNKDAAPVHPNRSTLEVFTAIKRDVPGIEEGHYRQVMDIYEATKVA